MFHINDDVKRPWKLSAKWFNRVAAFLNNICGDGIICINRPDEPLPDRPVALSLNLQGLRDKFTPMLDYTIAPLTLKAIVDSSGTATLTLVYLPSLTLQYEGKSYSLTATTSTGGVVQNQGKWYGISANAYGDFYICESTTANKCYFSNAPLAASTGRWSFKVGTVASNGTVTQGGMSMRGDVVLKDEGGGGEVAPFPFQLKTVLTQQGTLSCTKIYIPDAANAVVLNNTTYVITGMNAISGEAGWYSIGAMSGNIWLNESGVDGNGNPTLAFGSSELTDATKVSFFVGNVGSDFKVKQNMSGAIYGGFLAALGSSSNEITHTTTPANASGKNYIWDTKDGKNLVFYIPCAVVDYGAGGMGERFRFVKASFNSDGILKKVEATSYYVDVARADEVG